MITRLSGLRVLAACILLAGCRRKDTFEAPQPTAMPDVDSLPSLPASIIEVPLSLDLTPILATIEKAVPKHFGDIDKRIVNPANKRMHFAFEATRDPFAIRLDGDTVRMSTVINYSGKGWYNPPLAPEISASCGKSNERPRARVEVVSPVRLSSEWKLRTHTQVRTVAAYTNTERDQCEVTLLKFDVTGKVVNAARDALEKNAPLIDSKVATIDLRSKFEEWWQVLQQPIRLTDTVWLALNPQSIHVDDASGKRKMLSTSVGLVAQPRIVVGKKPVVTPKPLPPQSHPEEDATGFHVLLEGVLAYDVASKLLTEELRGQKVGTAGQTIEVRNVRMFGLGAGRIALEVGFVGAAAGRIYFVGTPHYDYQGDRLYVPDLDYDVATENMIVRGMSWLKHDDLRDYLRNKARWPVGGLIKQGQAELIDGLNRELVPGVKLSGQPSGIDIVGVRAARDAVRVRARVDGHLRLAISSTH